MNPSNHTKKAGASTGQTILAYLLFPSVVGVLTGILVFLFKIASSYVMQWSKYGYALVRSAPAYLPLLLLSAAAIGICSALLLYRAKECRGGGIPTAVASIRGLIPMKWLQGIFAVFGSALLTYLAGVPLGNEGPSVQMGAAVGKGSSGLFGKKNRAWERYYMTGGACSGFAIATGAPLSGMIFALEEAHRRFSPTIFLLSSVSVLTGTVTQKLLSALFGVDTTFFDLTIREILPFRHLWVAVLIGIVCGLCALLFTRMYRFVQIGKTGLLGRIPFALKIVLIFVFTALFGFLCEDFIGSGHSLIEKILERHALWYVLLLALVVRALLMIFSNHEGITGGVFVPTLTFGAIISAVLSELLIAVGVIDDQYYAILIAVGMASFLSASARTPLTALVFSAEVLCATGNLLPVALGVVLSYMTAELWGKHSFTDTVIENRTERTHRGKTPIVVDSHMTVQPNAFALGLTLQDILWPPTCVVLSVEKSKAHSTEGVTKIAEGDVFHLHYQTYDPQDTLELLAQILGEQPEDKTARIHKGSDDHVIPMD